MTASPESSVSSVSPPPDGHAPRRLDFLRTQVQQDVNSQRYATVITRFPPEPNGFLHIGHAKSICLNFGIANEFGGRCHLRMDDTDPTKEDVSYVNSIQQDIRWLGFDWFQPMFYASDYFEQFHAAALRLIEAGHAYVDSLNEAEIREYRGTVTEAGKNSPHRDRTVAENLALFEQMRAGAYPDGAHVLRAKIDMANPNMKMRDPLLYRIRHAHHYRTGDQWCIYPLYDFAHPLSDAIEGVSHSICTLEFENNRELYDWVLEACGYGEPRPHQYEFARLNLNYSVMSKRKFLELVDKKFVTGWDDPRMPTISGLRRRGYTPEALRQFCEDIGISKANSTVDMAQLEHAIRDDLNLKVPRVMAVLRPLKVVIENYPEGQSETLDAPLYPHDVPKDGTRALPFGREVFIEQDDFSENPPKGYYRLSPGGEVRLRHAYIIRCEQVIKDATGVIVELRCTYDADTRSTEQLPSAPVKPERKVKGTIHWVPAKEAVHAEVRLYDRLYNSESPSGLEDLNPASLELLTNAVTEPYIATCEPGSRFQFERQGYFYADPEAAQDTKALVFNRIVSLKDSWAKGQKPVVEAIKAPPVAKSPAPKSKHPDAPRKPAAELVALTPAQDAVRNRYEVAYKLQPETARQLATNETLTTYFETAVGIAPKSPVTLANWIVNELSVAAPAIEVTTAGTHAETYTLPAITPAQLAALVTLIDTEVISGKIARDVFAEMLSSGETPEAIVERNGWQQISDESILMPIVEKVVADNPDNLHKYHQGRTNLFGFFVGQVLKETGGKANPTLVSELVKLRLSAPL